MIKTVISDLGKVLIFFDNGIFYKKLANHCPLAAEEIREEAFRKLQLIRAFNKGELMPKQFYDEVVEKFEASIGFDEFYSIYNDVFWPNQENLELLKKLKGHFKLILLSNTDVKRFGFIREKFPEVFYFDEYILSFEVGFVKPHPSIYRAAVERSGSNFEECVFIDDLMENVESAEKLGIKGILYTPQTDLKAELNKLGVTV